MTIDDVALRVSAALGAAGVPFILVGGFSSNYHGIPRSTKDADFVVKLSTPLNQEFAHTLGPEFKAESQLSFETNTGTQRQEFQVAGTLFKVEIFMDPESVSGEPTLTGFMLDVRQIRAVMEKRC